MKILVAVDGSAYTDKAVQYVISHLDWFRGEPELHLLHVRTPIPTGYARAAAGSAALETYYREESHAALAAAERQCEAGKIPFQAGYKVGEVAEEIHAYVKKHGIDLIVMGSHGRGAFRSLVMGSTATKVLATASVPVLIVR
ncbi:universal stress protein [Noviherbaspirillum cavernae]|uniref:Universal stress protein n=1 Tax=Noviherbaspirillum cavernae TaxID=2320862 RepID=A0A418X0V9_9BURK|nr:universal stress protein [Noviherbaspirillum cavernae]RJG06124.1 universal stress protein [Noviherbaspirillum cavernae]